MNKISNWLFHWWYAKQLKEIQDLPFKMKIETDALKSNCILEIENEIEPLWLSIKGNEYKLGIKTVQNNRTRIHRYDFEKQSILPNPVFSANQIVDITSKFWLYTAIVVFFCTAESFLYSLTAALFVPGGGLFLQVPVAIFLALLIMLGLDYAFEKHFLYREIVERHGKKELTDLELHKYRDTRNIGYIIIVLSIAAILFSGFARIFFLEYIPTKGLTPERAISVIHASRMASIFTMLVTLIAALFMAMLKRDQAKIGKRYWIYRGWHLAHVRRNNYTQSIICNAEKIKITIERRIEKYWQLIIDLKRIYKMKTEHDEKYEALHKEYVQLKAKPGFIVTDDVYSKFDVVQCVYEELFRYGVMNARAIKDKLALATEILAIPKEHLAEHLALIPMHKDDNTIQTFILPAINGKANHHEFLTQ